MRELSPQLVLSERTVEQHVSLLKEKPGLRERAQLAVHAAAQSALVDRSPDGAARIRDSPNVPGSGQVPA